VQSPLLASLVLMKSHVAKAIERAIANGVCISIYMDDFIGSHSDPAILRAAYDEIRKACLAAGLIPNPDKLVPPSEAIVAFNCNLAEGAANVTSERVAQYLAKQDRTPMSDEGFEQYRLLVVSANKAPPPPSA